MPSPNNMRFPQMHIAESVVNRLMNFSDEINAPAAPEIPPTGPTPQQVGTQIQSQQIDTALQQPTQPVAPTGDGTTNDVAGGMVAGQDLSQTSGQELQKMADLSGTTHGLSGLL